MRRCKFRNGLYTNIMVSRFAIYLEPFYNSILQTYQDVVTLDLIPSTPLCDRVSIVNFPKLSPFSERRGCVPVILQSDKNNIMTRDDLPELFSYLLDNGYAVNTEITSILHNQKRELIAYITNP